MPKRKCSNKYDEGVAGVRHKIRKVQSRGSVTSPSHSGATQTTFVLQEVARANSGACGFAIIETMAFVWKIRTRSEKFIWEDSYYTRWGYYRRKHHPLRPDDWFPEFPDNQDDSSRIILLRVEIEFVQCPEDSDDDACN